MCGPPDPNPDHAAAIVRAALDIRDFMEQRRKQPGSQTFEVRIGINSGSVLAGIVGNKKFAYDIWGDAVNTAARMEQSGVPGKVNISEHTYALVHSRFECTYRGEVAAKHKGNMKMYLVENSSS